MRFFIKYNFKNLMFVIFVFLLSQFNTVAQEITTDKETKQHNGFNGSVDNISESDIVTKIYKSVDRPTKHFKEEYTQQTIIDKDLLNKDELIRDKRIQFKKLHEEKNRMKQFDPKNELKLPFVIFFVFVGILILMFNIVKKYKI